MVGGVSDKAFEVRKKRKGEDEMTNAVIDLACYDWLHFPHWDKALELDNFPDFLLWLNEQDTILAAIVATRQEEFELVFQRIKDEINSGTAASAFSSSNEQKEGKKAT